MSWLGIPYPLSETKFLDSGILSVSRVPEIFVNTGFGWDNVVGTILAAFVGALIPALIAFYSIRKNDVYSERLRKQQKEDLEATINTQLKVSTLSFNAQVLSNNRQGWINNVRDLTSDFVSLCEDFISSRYFYYKAFKQLDRFSAQDEATREYRDRTYEIKREIIKVKTNIELMLNPNELTSKAIFVAMNRIVSVINEDDFKHTLFRKDGNSWVEYNKTKLAFIKVMKRCLKTEWKRVKNGE